MGAADVPDVVEDHRIARHVQCGERLEFRRHWLPHIERRRDCASAARSNPQTPAARRQCSACRASVLRRVNWHERAVVCAPPDTSEHWRTRKGNGAAHFEAAGATPRVLKPQRRTLCERTVDVGSGVGSADPDVVQPAVVTGGQCAAGVDNVATNAGLWFGFCCGWRLGCTGPQVAPLLAGTGAAWWTRSGSRKAMWSFASKPHARTGCSGADSAFGGSARGEVDPLERPIRPVEPCADHSPERFVQVGVGSAHPRPGPHVHPVEG